MSKLDAMVVSGKIKAQKGIERLMSKKAGDSQIVVALVLIAVAVGLCIIFRNEINTIMKNLINTITTTINDLAKGVVE